MITIRSIMCALAFASSVYGSAGAMELSTKINYLDYGMLSCMHNVNGSPQALIDALACLIPLYQDQPHQSFDCMIVSLSQLDLGQIIDDEGCTAFHVAVKPFDYEKFFDITIFDLLLKAVKDVDEFIAIKNNRGHTVLDVASFWNNKQAVSRIITALENPYKFICTSSKDGWSVVHNAAIWGRCDLLKLYFATAGSPEQKRHMMYLENNTKSTPFSLARGKAKPFMKKYIDSLGF